MSEPRIYWQFLEILNKNIALTQRSEAAEARRREIDDEAFDYAEQLMAMTAERDALRKLLRLCARTCDTLDHGPGKDFHAFNEPCPIIPRIDAALAVQP